MLPSRSGLALLMAGLLCASPACADVVSERCIAVQAVIRVTIDQPGQVIAYLGLNGKWEIQGDAGVVDRMMAMPGHRSAETECVFLALRDPGNSGLLGIADLTCPSTDAETTRAFRRVKDADPVIRRCLPDAPVGACLPGQVCG